MRVGIYFSAGKNNGGIYQYSLSLLEAISKSGHNLTIFNISADLVISPEITNYHVIDLKKKPGVAGQNTLIKKCKNIILRVVHFFTFFHIYWPSNIIRIKKEKVRAKQIDQENLDCIFFPNDSDVSIVCKTPVIASIHDLQHRINPHFPEISEDGQLQWREYFFSKLTKHAKILLADSEVGKEYITEFYSIEKEKISVLPYLAPDYLEHLEEKEIEKIKEKLNLPEKFFFYPAQLWPHKNHLNIIEALRTSKLDGFKMSVVLSGGKKEKWHIYEKIISKAKEYELSNSIIYLGYVDNKTISALYAEAIGLVMPTFFGPSNIPILEAWKLECPVIYSDIRGCREQAGDAALLCNPNNPKDIAEKMNRLWNNENLRKELIQKGQKRLSQWTKTDFYNKISTLLKNF